MGGQACVFYGAAEFSRDLDLLILADEANLERLKAALADLEADRIAVPDLKSEFLDRGHAVHFRCQRPDVAGLRVDVMSAPRGVASFEELWERRTTIESDGETIDLLSAEDLATAKRTQRDKDWPMIRRLVEQDYFRWRDHGEEPDPGFWLRHLRTPDLLVSVAAEFPEAAREAAQTRPAVAAAIGGGSAEVQRLLVEEEACERAADAEYWRPLRQELEELRRGRRP